MGQSLKDFLNESLINEAADTNAVDSNVKTDPKINAGDTCIYNDEECTVQSVDLERGIVKIHADGQDMDVKISEITKKADQVDECAEGDAVMYDKKKYKAGKVADGKVKLTADGDYDDEDDIDVKEVKVIKESVNEACKEGDDVMYNEKKYKVKKVKESGVMLTADGDYEDEDDIDAKDVEIVKDEE